MLRYEKVEPGDEQVLDEREQRELDAVPSALDPAGEDRAPRPERKKSVSERQAGPRSPTLELHDSAVAHDLRMR